MQRSGRRHCRRAVRGLVLLLLLVPVAAAGASAALTNADCGAPGVTALADVRGHQGEPLPSGREVTVEAAVTAGFPGREGLNGFFLESESPRVGVFVYAPDLNSGDAPVRGERWRVQARTGRYRGRIQLEAVADAIECGPQALPPVTVSATQLADPESYMARLVRLQGPLTVTDTYHLGRYGSLRLSLGSRRFHPGTGIAGGSSFPVVLDDGSYRRDPRPVPHLGPDGVRRAGDTLNTVTGVVTRAFGDWRLHPVEPASFVASNPRPEPPSAPSDLRAAHLNLENYFLTRDGRGPDTEAGFRRQRERLRETLAAIDADLLVLHEIENRPEAVADLVNLLNRDEAVARHYRPVLNKRSPAVIRSVILYRPAVLELREARRQTHAVHPRDPVAARFRDDTGRELIVIGVHAKSRGGCPETGDIDRGEGCWAERRKAQAEALVTWLDDWLGPRGIDQAPVLLMGDLNAHAREAAIAPLRAAGLRDQLAARIRPAERYTYIYRGRSGYLDHVFASAAAAARVAGLSTWPVNADEPDYLRPDGEGVWRASDHDPIVVDLR